MARPVKPKKLGATARRPQHKHAADIAAWYRGKSFSIDWTSWHFPNWLRLLRRYRGRPARVVEIGSWEGRSALFFLNYLPHARIVCIDTFAGGKDHLESRDYQSLLRRVERRFDANTREFGPRVRKIKATSADALSAIAQEGRRFDIAYIDGSHRAEDVKSDASLSWPLMRTGGLVIFDDYLWDNQQGPSEIPGPGIDGFLASIEGQYRLVYKGYQLAIVKH